MKRFFSVFLCVFVLIFFSGCDKLMEIYGYRKPRPKGVQNVEVPNEIKKVDDESLAKLLLKPERKAINIVRDPFKPLLWEPEKVVDPQTGKKTEVNVDITLLGIIKLGSDYSASLKSGTQKGLFKVGDTIEKLTVKEISANQVILSNGEKDIKLERKK